MAIRGYVDGIIGNHVVGWAHDPDHPDDRLELELELAEAPLGCCVADLDREDLRRAGIGDGRHGFRHPLNRTARTGDEHRVVVRALVDGSALSLASDYIPAVGSSDDSGLPSAAGDRPSLELEGAAGWRFAFAGTEAQARALGHRRVRPAQLEALAERELERERRLAGLGAGYVLVTLPDKALVYTEYLPPEIVAHPADRPAAQLARALRPAAQLDPLDLLPALLDARSGGRVFNRTGSGLTWLGAFAAYRAVAKELARRGWIETPLPPGWLARRGLTPVPAASETSRRHGQPEFEPRLDDRHFTATELALPAELASLAGPEDRALTRPDHPGPTAVLVTGAAGRRLTPFLAEHFGRTLVLSGTRGAEEFVQRTGAAVVVRLVADGEPGPA